MTTDPAALAASINAALTATDTAARALWEAMGAPGTFGFGSISTGVSEVSAYFDLDEVIWGCVDADIAGVTRVRVFSGHTGERPPLNHTGTLDSCRAALAAYLGAS